MEMWNISIAINPNDPTATLQTQAPLYGPDICPNGQNLKTQLFWWVKKDAWIFCGDFHAAEFDFSLFQTNDVNPITYS